MQNSCPVCTVGVADCHMVMEAQQQLSDFPEGGSGLKSYHDIMPLKYLEVKGHPPAEWPPLMRDLLAQTERKAMRLKSATWFPLIGEVHLVKPGILLSGQV